jgi:hypothetical protein
MLAVLVVAEKVLPFSYMQLAELSLFVTDKVYLIKEEFQVIAPNSDTFLLQNTEYDEEKPVEKKSIVSYKAVLFVFDKELDALSEETFKNLVTKGLLLQEGSYSTITQEQVDFSSPNEIASVKVILFGVPFTGYQTKYKMTSNGKQLVLFADSMERIAANVDLKRQLWAQLQLMFSKPV